jgi:hypothetical protein
VKSSVTGTYAVSTRNNDTDSSFVNTYTINSANTWEHKTVTFSAQTAGTWLNTTGIGVRLWWDLGSGDNFNADATGQWRSSANYLTVSNQADVVGTSGALWYLTGVQLEVGNTSTDFEHHSYGEELSLCQRYFQGQGTTAATMDASGATKQTQMLMSSSLSFTSGATHRLQLNMQKPMRAAPTVYISDNNGTLGKAYWSATNTTAATYFASNYSVSLLLTAVTSSSTTDMWVNYSLEAEL